MNNRTLRIGFLGSGFIAEFHRQAMVAVRDVEIRAVWSPTKKHREAFVHKCNDAGLGPTQSFGSLDELLSTKGLDAIWLLGPNDTRLDHMRALNRAVLGRTSSIRAVACEKPLARNIAEAKEMVNLAKAANLNTAYLENQVFAPSVVRGKEIIWRKGVQKAGRPYLARASEEHSGPHMPWFWQAERQGGGVLLDMMCHSIEVARFLLSEPGAKRTSLRPVSATASTASLKWSRPIYAKRLKAEMGDHLDYQKRPAEDVAHGQIELATKTASLLMIEASTSWAYVGPGLRISIELLGPEYSMQIDTLATGLKVFLSRDIDTRKDEDLVEKQNSEQGLMPVLEDEAGTYGYVAENRHVVQSFLNDTSGDETFEDGLGVIELLMALYRSEELRRTYFIDEEDLSNYIPQVARID